MLGQDQIHRLGTRSRRGMLAGRRLGELQLDFARALERASEREEDQQQEQHVDERRDVQVHVLRGPGLAELDAAHWACPPCGRSRDSSQLACVSISAIMRSDWAVK